MRRIIILMTMLSLMASCSSDDDKNTSESNDLMGNWKLIEIYSDPGDGSGGFVAVDSDKVIMFEANGAVQSNGNLCNGFSDAGVPSEGIFSEENETISVDTCGIESFQISFEILADNLILSYPCIEACQEKYIKVN